MVDDNKPNDESDDSGGGSGSGDDGDTNLAPTFKLKKDGKVVPMSNQEVQDYLDEVREKEAKIGEKDKGASQKFREADHALKLRSTMLKVRSDNSQEALEALRLLEKDFPEAGITKDMVGQAEAQVRATGNSLGDSKGPGDSTEDQGPIRADELDDDLQDDLREMREDKVRRRTGVIIGKLKEALDKDPDIRDIMNDESLARVSKRVRNEALGVLQRKAGEHARQNPGKRSSWSPKPADFREAVQEARVFLMDLGYLDDPGNEDSETQREDALPVPTSGRSPSARSPGSQRRSKEPLKRPSAENSAEYEEYMAEQLARGLS